MPGQFIITLGRKERDEDSQAWGCKPKCLIVRDYVESLVWLSGDSGPHFFSQAFMDHRVKSTHALGC